MVSMLLIIGNLFGQNLSVNSTYPNNNPIWLAQNIIAGQGMTVFSPIGANGLPLSQPSGVQFGKFVSGNPNFGLDSGVVICTSDASDVVIGQSGSYTTYPTQSTSNFLSSVLSQIGSTATNLYDLGRIAFSFIGPSDSIKFDYVFASREYASYTCSSFNDVFGIFLVGPGINGAPMYNANGTVNIDTINLATIPGGNIPVAINTINQGYPSGSFPASNCLNANPNYVQNSSYYNVNNSNSGLNTGYGGYTDVFQAKAQITCGVLYSLWVEIADISDGSFNSAVFIGSGNAMIPKIELNVSYPSNDSIIYEGCKPGQFIVSRSVMVSDTCVINFSYGGSAQNGVDYSGLPSSITLLPFQVADTFAINVVNDGISETTDTIMVVMSPVSSQCAVYPAQYLNILIADLDSSLKTNAQILSDSTAWFRGGDTSIIYAYPADFEGIAWSVVGGVIIGPNTNDTISVLWNISDSIGSIIATVDNGVCFDTLRVTKNISQIGLQDHSVRTPEVLPNPNDGYFTIEVGEALVGASYVIVDGMGRPIESGEIRSKTQAFDLANKPKGVYSITITGKSTYQTMIVVLQ